MDDTTKPRDTRTISDVLAMSGAERAREHAQDFLSTNPTTIVLLLEWRWTYENNEPYSAYNLAYRAVLRRHLPEEQLLSGRYARYGFGE
jgi:hypothetical protein